MQDVRAGAGRMATDTMEELVIKQKKRNFAPASLFLGALLSLPSASLYADTALKSRFGFTIKMPDAEWFVIGPKEARAAGTGASAASAKASSKDVSGIARITDQELLQRLFKQVNSQYIEFFYDGKYAGTPLKNNISLQVSKPIILHSVDEAKKISEEKCNVLPQEVKSTFGQDPMMHSCKLIPVNGRAVFHHSYTLPSQGATLISDEVPVSKKYSVLLSGASINGAGGLRRLRAGQRALLDALTRFLNEKQLPAKK
ncbi:hypothetical protein [Microbulbifer sp. SAOS-129_SWC]|uniref:hypothetical protein n=1 Tax=Microbulbifer sp. SAOS-129_SWC TaxID=3145235 RepID=UPI00321703D5